MEQVVYFTKMFVAVQSKARGGPKDRVTDSLSHYAKEIYTAWSVSFLNKHMALGPAEKSKPNLKLIPSPQSAAGDHVTVWRREENVEMIR